MTRGGRLLKKPPYPIPIQGNNKMRRDLSWGQKKRNVGNSAGLNDLAVHSDRKFPDSFVLEAWIR